MQKLAIIGAGISGLTLAQKLKPYFDITVFDKGRSVGGRTSTHYTNDFNFDYGTQFFTIKNSEVLDFIQPAIKKEVIKPWCGGFVEIDKDIIISKRDWDDKYPHYVGCPQMNSLAKYLANGLNVELQEKVTTLQKQEKWCLYNLQNKRLGEFDWVVTSIPPQQAANISPKPCNYYNKLLNTNMSACFALMLGFIEPIDLSWQAALVKNTDISWISVNSSKPTRNSKFSLLINSTNKWADSNFNLDTDRVSEHLCKTVSSVLNYDVSNADYIKLHRWRYANIKKQADYKPLIDTNMQIAACGDWNIQGRIEAAMLSAISLATKMCEL